MIRPIIQQVVRGSATPVSVIHYLSCVENFQSDNDDLLSVINSFISKQLNVAELTVVMSRVVSFLDEIMQ